LKAFNLPAFDFIPNEICNDAQVASNEKGLIVPVTFHIPGALREFTAGRSTVEIKDSPATLADALSALWILYPGVRDRIATDRDGTPAGPAARPCWRLETI